MLLKKIYIFIYVLLSAKYKWVLVFGLYPFTDCLGLIPGLQGSVKMLTQCDICEIEPQRCHGDSRTAMLPDEMLNGFGLLSVRSPSPGWGVAAQGTLHFIPVHPKTDRGNVQLWDRVLFIYKLPSLQSFYVGPMSILQVYQLHFIFLLHQHPIR